MAPPGAGAAGGGAATLARAGDSPAREAGHAVRGTQPAQAEGDGDPGPPAEGDDDEGDGEPCGAGRDATRLPPRPPPAAPAGAQADGPRIARDHGADHPTGVACAATPGGEGDRGSEDDGCVHAGDRAIGDNVPALEQGGTSAGLEGHAGGDRGHAGGDDVAGATPARGEGAPQAGDRVDAAGERGVRGRAVGGRRRSDEAGGAPGARLEGAGAGAGDGPQGPAGPVLVVFAGAGTADSTLARSLRARGADVTEID
eukprot:2446793-Pleurochrysis_carterae.AAC.1